MVLLLGGYGAWAWQRKKKSAGSKFQDSVLGAASVAPAIAGDAAAPGFENTVAALERSGRLLARVANVFYVLAGAHTNEAIQAIERDMAPKLAAHETAIMLNAKIFKRVGKEAWRPIACRQVARPTTARAY